MKAIPYTDVKKRYAFKIASLCENIDPYKIKETEMSRKYEDLPKIEYINLFNYLVLTTSSYTQEQMCAYKSLEAYKQFESGWVRDLRVKEIPNAKRIVKTSVLHSMRISLPALKPWVLCTLDGTILTAHCTCIAGLSEVCTHAAATLYAVESLVRNFNSRSKTDILCQWNRPKQNNAIIKNMPIRDMRFIIKERIAQTYSTSLTTWSGEDLFDMANDIKGRISKHISLTLVTKGLNEEFEKSLQSFQSVGIPSVPTIEPRSSQIGSAYDDISLTDTIRAVKMFMVNIYYKKDFKGMNLKELLIVAKDVKVNLSEDDIRYVKRVTVAQNKSWLWETFRAGRVTGSTFKRVCTTSLAKPAKSTI